jgi:hypothetical protein
MYRRYSYMFLFICIIFREPYTYFYFAKVTKISKISYSLNSIDWSVILTGDDKINLQNAVSSVSCYSYSMWQLLAWWQCIHIREYVVHLLVWVLNTRLLCKAYSCHGSDCNWTCRVAVFRQWRMDYSDCYFADTTPPPPFFLATKLLTRNVKSFTLWWVLSGA